MTEEGEYGIVRVIKGPHKGRVGLYDNDADQPGRAVVYFGIPFVEGHNLVWRKWLEPVNVAHYGLEKFKRKYPSIANMVL